MSQDVSNILNAWKYEPDDLLVRLIQGNDGRPKLQLRIDLGILQMEMDGRPDGQRPKGSESWLDYYERQQHAHDAQHPDAASYALDEEACLNLWREGLQYYHRYLGFLHLGLFDLCARDTQRNLRLFAFVRAHARDDRHKMQFDQWRPYVIMIHTRAVAAPLVRDKNFAQALQAIDGGIDAIRDFLDEYQQSHRAEECAELTGLEHWREEVAAEAQAAEERRPKSPLQRLRKRLDKAIAAEEFEEAARLRDEIRRMGPVTNDE
jgi:hypothetical protein